MWPLRHPAQRCRLHPLGQVQASAVALGTMTLSRRSAAFVTRLIAVHLPSDLTTRPGQSPGLPAGARPGWQRVRPMPGRSSRRHADPRAFSCAGQIGTPFALATRPAASCNSCSSGVLRIGYVPAMCRLLSLFLATTWRGCLFPLVDGERARTSRRGPGGIPAEVRVSAQPLSGDFNGSCARMPAHPRQPLWLSICSACPIAKGGDRAWRGPPRRRGAADLRGSPGPVARPGGRPAGFPQRDRPHRGG